MSKQRWPAGAVSWAGLRGRCGSRLGAQDSGPGWFSRGCGVCRRQAAVNTRMTSTNSVFLGWKSSASRCACSSCDVPRGIWSSRPGSGVPSVSGWRFSGWRLRWHVWVDAMDRCSAATAPFHSVVCYSIGRHCLLRIAFRRAFRLSWAVWRPPPPPPRGGSFASSDFFPCLVRRKRASTFGPFAEGWQGTCEYLTRTLKLFLPHRLPAFPGHAGIENRCLSTSSFFSPSRPSQNVGLCRRLSLPFSFPSRLAPVCLLGCWSLPSASSIPVAPCLRWGCCVVSVPV